MNIELTEKEIKFLMQYAQVYEQERQVDCTADPIVVVEDIEELIAADGYGDKTVYGWYDETYYSIDDLKKALADDDYSENEISEFCDDLEYYGHCKNQEIQKYSVHVTYRPVAYFLTRAEADKYVKYQFHNLRKPRVYTRYCGYANFGDLPCLCKLLSRMGQKLNKNNR